MLHKLQLLKLRSKSATIAPAQELKIVEMDKNGNEMDIESIFNKIIDL